MKTFFIAVACFMAVLPAIKAQDCSHWSNYDLRGTYLMSGSGQVDLSRFFPGKGFPSGLSPMTFVGGHVYNGAGRGTGWVSMNMGGTQMNPEYGDYSYSVQPDCSVVVTYTLKFTALGVTLPFARVGVIVPKPGGLEIHSHAVGRPVGTPAGAGWSVNVLHRVSMQY